MKRPLPDEGLPEAWQDWLRSAEALLVEALVPLFLLHCRRGQSKVPLAALASTLDAAGGKPLPGSSAEAAARLLARLCPEALELHEGASKEQASITFRVTDEALGVAEERARGAAMCAGVVAKGFSLALPPEKGSSEVGMRDAQGKRWRKAQGSFYADVGAVERELEQLKAGMLDQLSGYADAHREEDPPSLLEEVAPFAPGGGGPPAAEPAEDKEAQSREEAAAAPQEVQAPPQGSEGVSGFVAALQGHPEYRQQVCHVENYPARPAEYASLDDLVDAAGRPLLSAPVVEALRRHLGIERLFKHQHASLKAVLGEKRHLCLTTGTSSGKSLAFALPILEDFRRDPNTRALILFPTKALAQDQLGKLQRLFGAVCPSLGVCTFDGDTPRGDRADLLKKCHVFLSNPDMLHFTILASHARWRHILEGLKYVVLDEAHVYRSAFGCHMALLLRRFRRILQHYRSSPVFVACSATMRNARPFFAQLLALGAEGDQCAIVDEDTAGRGERQFCLWNPPLIEPEEGSPQAAGAFRGQRNDQKRARFREREGNAAAPKLPPGVGFRTRSSSYDEAAWVLAQAMRRGHRTVCFLQCRSMVEIVLQATHAHLEDRADLQGRLAGYRGGYAAEERRRLERRLFSGDLLGVVATNALELGIDIGDLDLTIHVGVPPTVASVWQQAGRAGRRGRASAAVLVAMDAPLEQHFCRHPSEFFSRSLEARLPDVGNEFLLRGHLFCAAVELPPLGEAEALSWFGEACRPVLDGARREGHLVAQAPRSNAAAAAAAQNGGGEVLMRYCQGKGKKAPKEEVSLRDIDPVQFQVIIRGNKTPLETLDQKMTFMRVHPGALYLNQQWAYFVEELDLNARIAWVVPRNPKQLDYYTECREHTQVVLSGGGAARAAELKREVLDRIGTPVVRFGGVSVYWRMYGFKKLSKQDRRIIDTIDLSLPPVEFPSQAVWMDLPGPVLQPVAQAGHSVDRGGLHALEHAMIAIAPLCCDIETMELSCQHTRRDTDPNRYLLLLYESQKGGTGTASKVFAQWEELLRRAATLVEECPCEQGCPNCVVTPLCGEYNHGLDKAAALKIASALGLTRQVFQAELPAADIAGGTDSGLLAGGESEGPGLAQCCDEERDLGLPTPPKLPAPSAQAPQITQAAGDRAEKRVGVFARSLAGAGAGAAHAAAVCLDLD